MTKLLDITQEILMMTYESLEKFRRESKFSTWLYSIMSNYCKNHQKKAHRYRSVSIDGSNNDNYDFQLTDSPGKY